MASHYSFSIFLFLLLCSLFQINFVSHFGKVPPKSHRYFNWDHTIFTDYFRGQLTSLSYCGLQSTHKIRLSIYSSFLLCPLGWFTFLPLQASYFLLCLSLRNLFFFVVIMKGTLPSIIFPNLLYVYREAVDFWWPVIFCLTKFLFLLKFLFWFSWVLQVYKQTICRKWQLCLLSLI